MFDAFIAHESFTTSQISEMHTVVRNHYSSLKHLSILYIYRSTLEPSELSKNVFGLQNPLIDILNHYYFMRSIHTERKRQRWH